MWSSGGWRKKGTRNDEQAPTTSSKSKPSSASSLASPASRSSAASSASSSSSSSKRSSAARRSKKADANRQLANIIARNRGGASVKRADSPTNASRVVKPKHRVTATVPSKDTSSSTSHNTAPKRVATFPRKHTPETSEIKRSFTGGKIGTLQKTLNLNALLAGGPPPGFGARPRALGSTAPPRKSSKDESAVMTKDTKCPEMEHHTLSRPRRARTKRPSRPRFSQEKIESTRAASNSMYDDFEVPALDDASWEDELAA